MCRYAVSRVTVYIDPLDGTNEYAVGLYELNSVCP